MARYDELYQEVILTHNNNPRNFLKIPDANRVADGYNPLCGDQVTIYLRIENGVICDVGFQGSGCAISRASASLMTQSVKGKNVEAAQKIFESFHRMVTTGEEISISDDDLGDLEALSGVSKFPTRVKCASLSWHTFRAALVQKESTTSTEKPSVT